MSVAEQKTEIPEALLQKVNPMLDKAKLQLLAIKKSTFTTTILFSLRFKWDLDIPTANVDGVNMSLNPNFFAQLAPPERVFVLAHEAWHVAFEHITRFTELGEGACFRTYNEAADHVINNMLKAKGYAVPDWTSCNPKYANCSTEQVYYDLMREKSQDPNFVPDFTPSSGSSPDKPQDGNNPTKMTKQEISNKIDEMLVKANMASKMNPDEKGHSEDVPDCIAERIEDLVNPKVDWRTLLRNFMLETARDDYSYRRPNRRYMPDIILPSLYSEGMGKLSVGIDVSGSVSDEQFNAFRSEINEMKEIMNPEITEITQWHHRLAKTDVIDRYEDLEGVEFKETGGTNVYPLLEKWIKNPPTVGIIFTDGYFTPWDKPELITFPVIWVVYDNPEYTVDFGQVVQYEPDID